jgi:hypothetical protein
VLGYRDPQCTALILPMPRADTESTKPIESFPTQVRISVIRMIAAISVAPEEDKLVWVLLAVTSVVMALPPLLFGWAPVTDLGDHALMLSALADYGNPERFPTSVYELRLGGPNQLIFAFGYVLMQWLEADLAVRVLLGAILGSVPWALAHAAKTFGRSRLVAVVVAPMALGFAFRWGLLAYLMAMLLVLLALRPFMRLVAAPTPRNAAVSSVAMVLAALAHTSSVAVLGLVAIPHVLRRWREPRCALWSASPVVVSVCVAVCQMVLFNKNSSEVFRKFGNITHPRIERIAMLPGHLVGYFSGHEALALCGLVLVSFVLLTLRGQRPDDTRSQSVTAMVVIAQYFIWPYGYNGAGLLYLRFLLPGVWLLALALSPRTLRIGSLASAVLVVPLAATVAVLPQYQSTQLAYRALARLTSQVTEGSAIAALDFAPPTPDNFGVPGGAASYLVSKRGGRAWSFADTPQMPVRTRAAVAWFSGIRFQNPNNFVPELDLERYRYLLAHVPDERFLHPFSLALGDCGRPVAYVKPFALVESRCLKYGLNDPEPALPKIRPKTLGWRLRQLQAQSQQTSPHLPWRPVPNPNEATVGSDGSRIP